MSPLWVISLFLTLTETVLGVGVFNTAGGVQGTLTAFVVCFPVLVAAGFFAILWKKPFVLYTPTDYGGEVTPQHFVEAIRSGVVVQRDDLYVSITEAMTGSVASQETVDQILETVGKTEEVAPKHELQRVLREVVTQAVDVIKETNFVTVDARQATGADAEAIWQIPYEKHGTAARFLDDIWFRLNFLGAIPPYSYGRRWTIKDSRTGRSFSDMGRQWARNQGLADDNRSLNTLGIVPGMTLEVELT